MKTLFTLTASAVILAGSLGLAQAQQSSGEQMMQQQDQQGQGMTGSGMGMSPEMMQRMMMGYHHGMGRGHRGPRSGMMRRGMHGMGHRGMMRIMFAIIDADGDRALSLEEVREAHTRIFNHVDADGDGRVTLEEIQAFYRGRPRAADADDTGDTGDTDDTGDMDE